MYNPASGKHRWQGILASLLPRLQQSGIGYERFETAINTKVILLDHSFTDIIVIGGDGTINLALNAIRGQYPVVFNLIPAGTGNDFVKNISIGQSLEEQIHTICNGQVVSVDMGRCNDRLFVNGVGLGFDGQIVADMLHRKIWLTGHARYYYHVLSILATFKPVKLDYQVAGEIFSKNTLLLLIANGSTFGGGFKLAPDTSLTDGHLDLCHIGDVSPLKRFLHLPKLEKGTHGQLEEVGFDKIKNISISKNPAIIAHIDGEYLGNPPFEIEVLPGQLKLRVKNPG